ncbi:hypothetical protein P3342_011649 [Pyrenophora teres f. teres]|nr:hypothetical protein P3342_011649 [Pyrenophora teres f. teres]
MHRHKPPPRRTVCALFRGPSKTNVLSLILPFDVSRPSTTLSTSFPVHYINRVTPLPQRHPFLLGRRTPTTNLPLAYDYNCDSRALLRQLYMVHYTLAFITMRIQRWMDTVVSH